MIDASQPRASSQGGESLRWPGQVVSAEELRRSLNGHRELLVSARAIVTPSAAELLRAMGIPIRREQVQVKAAAPPAWGIAQERPLSHVSNALQSLKREGIAWAGLPAQGPSSLATWARALAGQVSRGECQGAVVFCDAGSLLCCVANKVARVRAALVGSALEAARATATLGANFVAVPPAGRTFFELRQIVRTLCRTGPSCPTDIAQTLQELDGHAHR